MPILFVFYSGFSILGLLKNAVSCVLIAQRIRRTYVYASSSSPLAALLIANFEQPLAVRRAFVNGCWNFPYLEEFIDYSTLPY